MNTTQLNKSTIHGLSPALPFTPDSTGADLFVSRERQSQPILTHVERIWTCFIMSSARNPCKMSKAPNVHELRLCQLRKHTVTDGAADGCTDSQLDSLCRRGSTACAEQMDQPSGWGSVDSCHYDRTDSLCHQRAHSLCHSSKHSLCCLSGTGARSRRRYRL